MAIKIPHGSMTRAALAVTLLLVLAGAGAGLKNGSAAPSYKNYTTTITGAPAAGTTFSAGITLKNEASSNTTLGAEDIVLPIGYTATAAAISPPSGKSWSMTIGSRSLSDGAHPVIQLRANSNGDGLVAGTSLTATVPVTVPCSISGDQTWQTEAKQSNSFSGPPGNDFLSTVGTLNTTTHLYALPTPPAPSGGCSFEFVNSTTDTTEWQPDSNGYRAGHPFTVTVEALDGAGHPRTPSGTATISGLSSLNGHSPSYDDGATGSPHVSFNGGSFAVVSVTAVKKEHASLTVTDDSDATQTTTSAGFDVWPGDPAQLTISNVDAAQVVDQAITPSITVGVYDAYGNKEDCGDPCVQGQENVYLDFGTDGGFDTLSTPAGSPIAGNGQVMSDNGSATFSDVTIGRSGSGFTLVAKDGTHTSAPTNTFTVYDNLCRNGQGPGNSYNECGGSLNGASIDILYPVYTTDSTLLQLSLHQNVTCGGSTGGALGALITWTPAGTTIDPSVPTYDYRNPIKVTLRWDKTLVPGTGVSNFTLCIAKTPGSYSVVQDCPAKLKPSTPLPCASKRSRNNAGDLVIVLLTGSNDPIAGLH